MLKPFETFIEQCSLAQPDLKHNPQCSLAQLDLKQSRKRPN